MKTNILFIIPPALPYDQIEQCGVINYDTYIPTSIPLGVLSISSFLKSNTDVEIEILDFNIVLNKSKKGNMSFKNILIDDISMITKDFKPSIIGISALFNSNFSYLNIISETIKELFIDALVIVGGGLPTNLYEEVLSTAPHIDAVCYSEGEIPLLNLVKSHNRNEHLKQEPYWITREKITDGFHPEAVYVHDLDEIPSFDYSLINFDDYQLHSRYHGDSENAVTASMMTSRGCPFSCCFCASHSVHGKKIRIMSAARVLSDIEVLAGQYKVNTILFEDDHFLIDKSRALEILRGLKGKNVSIEFPNGVAVYAIDEEIAEALKDAGVNMVTLAVESGSEYVLRNIIHKPLKLSFVSNAVSILRKLDIYIRAFFIIGFPGETEEYRNQTKEFIKATGFNWVAIMIATPIAGSELFRICTENNYLVSDNIEDFHYGKANIRTQDFTPEYIEAQRYLLNLELNFINNYDLINANFDIALIGFNDVIKRVPDHAFAYYCAALCHEKIGDNSSNEYMERFKEIISKDEKWKYYADYFKLDTDLTKIS